MQAQPIPDTHLLGTRRGSDSEGRQRRLTWSQLIRKVYEIDPLLCPYCGATMRIVAFLVDFASLRCRGRSAPAASHRSVKSGLPTAKRLRVSAGPAATDSEGDPIGSEADPGTPEGDRTCH